MKHSNQAHGIRAAATTIAAFLLLGAMQVAAADACATTTPLSGGTTYTSDGTGNVAGGYHYELWHDGGGSMKMTVYGVGAAFKADWNNAGDFLARTGLKFDETKTYDQYGNIVADYAFKKTGTGGGYSFIGIYGWTKSPLVEYYIVDDWFGSSPPTGGGTLKGSFQVDGGTYNIYTYTRVNMPSIIGNTTFPQFFSVRQTPRQCGHISISEHFKKWASLGLTLGKMYEAKILVEAGGGTGTFDLTYATMAINASTSSSSTTNSSSSVTPVVPQGAYSSATIPGIIQAENYDVGGEGVAYQDADATNSGDTYRTDGVDISGDATNGYVVGWTTAGEWLEYTINVATTGSYKWDARVSTNADGKKFHVLLDSTTDLTGPINVVNTGDWDTYGTVSGTTPTINAGKHTLRIAIDSSYINIDWLSFTESAVRLSPFIASKVSNNVGQYLVFTIVGEQIGKVNITNQQRLQAEVRKIAPQPGTYLVRPEFGNSGTIQIDVR